MIRDYEDFGGADDIEDLGEEEAVEEEEDDDEAEELDFTEGRRRWSALGDPDE